MSESDEDAFYDRVLANTPEYVRDMREAEDRYWRGESDSRPLSEVLDAVRHAAADPGAVEDVEYDDVMTEQRAHRIVEDLLGSPTTDGGDADSDRS